MREFVNPWLMDFVWVEPKWRRYGVATNMIKEAMKTKQISTFTSNDEADCLVEKLGFTSHFNGQFQMNVWRYGKLSI